MKGFFFLAKILPVFEQYTFSKSLRKLSPFLCKHIIVNIEPNISTLPAENQLLPREKERSSEIFHDHCRCLSAVLKSVVDVAVGRDATAGNKAFEGGGGRGAAG